MRPSYTGWINPAAKGLVGNQSQITQEDLLANFDCVRDSEVPNGEGSNKMLGTDEAADTFQKTEIATGFGVPSVPSDQTVEKVATGVLLNQAWRGTTGSFAYQKHGRHGRG